MVVAGPVAQRGVPQAGDEAGVEHGVLGDVARVAAVGDPAFELPGLGGAVEFPAGEEGEVFCFC